MRYGVLINKKSEMIWNVFGRMLGIPILSPVPVLSNPEVVSHECDTMRPLIVTSPLHILPTALPPGRAVHMYIFFWRQLGIATFLLLNARQGLPAHIVA